MRRALACYAAVAGALLHLSLAHASDVVSESTQPHPAGPVTTREWRHQPGDTPFRIDINRARSGITLVGKTRLVRMRDGRWIVVTETGFRLLLVSGPEQKLPVSLGFIDSRQRWSIQVKDQEIPRDIPGVSQEGEPSLAIVLRRR